MEQIDEVAEITRELSRALADEHKRMNEKAAASKARWEQKRDERETAKKELPGLSRKLSLNEKEIERLTEENRILSERIAGAEMLLNCEGSNVYDIVARAEADWKSDQFRADSFLQDKIKNMVGG